VSSKLLEVRKLRKSYEGFLALKDVDFALHSGQVKAIMGPNGAGKSTFLRLVSGETGVTSGSLDFSGRSLIDLSVNRVSRLGIAYMPQQPSLFPALTVEENVRGAAQTGFILSDSKNHHTVKTVLDLVGLGGKSGVTASELPFADKRLLDLAIALAAKPRLLLADEPTAGVDRDSSEKILKLLRELSSSHPKKEFGLDGLIFTEHDREVLFDFPDKIVFLRSGELIVEGTPEQVKRNNVVQNYLSNYRRFNQGEKGFDSGA